MTILRACDLVRHEAAAGPNSVRLRLGLLPTIALSWVLDALRRCAERLPGLELSLRDGDLPTLLGWVGRGRVEAALLSLDQAPSRHWVPIREEPIELVCAPGDPLAASGDRVRVALLDRRPFILRGHCERARDAETLLAARGIWPRITLRTDQDARAFDAVRAGLGVTLAPASLGRDLAHRPVEDLGLARTVGVALSPTLDPAIAARMIESLRDADAASPPAGAGQ